MKNKKNTFIPISNNREILVVSDLNPPEEINLFKQASRTRSYTEISQEELLKEMGTATNLKIYGFQKAGEASRISNVLFSEKAICSLTHEDVIPFRQGMLSRALHQTTCVKLSLQYVKNRFGVGNEVIKRTEARIRKMESNLVNLNQGQLVDQARLFSNASENLLFSAVELSIIGSEGLAAASRAAKTKRFLGQTPLSEDCLVAEDFMLGCCRARFHIRWFCDPSFSQIEPTFVRLRLGVEKDQSAPIETATTTATFPIVGPILKRKIIGGSDRSAFLPYKKVVVSHSLEGQRAIVGQPQNSSKGELQTSVMVHPPSETPIVPLPANGVDFAILVLALKALSGC